MPGSLADDKLQRRAQHYGLHLEHVAGEWRLSIPGGSQPFRSRRAFDVHRVISLHANALTRAHGRPEGITAMQEAFQQARGELSAFRGEHPATGRAIRSC